MRKFIFSLLLLFLLSSACQAAVFDNDILVGQVEEFGAKLYLEADTIKAYTLFGNKILEVRLKWIYDDKGKKLALQAHNADPRYKDIAYSENELQIKTERNLWLIVHRVDYNSKDEIISDFWDAEDEWDKIGQGNFLPVGRVYHMAKQYLEEHPE